MKLNTTIKLVAAAVAVCSLAVLTAATHNLSAQIDSTLACDKGTNSVSLQIACGDTNKCAPTIACDKGTNAISFELACGGTNSLSPVLACGGTNAFAPTFACDKGTNSVSFELACGDTNAVMATFASLQTATRTLLVL